MTDRRRGTDGEQGEQGKQGERGIRGISGFDGECCSGLVRLMERYKNTEAKVEREINDREIRANVNERKIDHETEEREKKEVEFWKEIGSINKRMDSMKTMAIVVLTSALGSILLFIGTTIAHLLKVGP